MVSVSKTLKFEQANSEGVVEMNRGASLPMTEEKVITDGILYLHISSNILGIVKYYT